MNEKVVIKDAANGTILAEGTLEQDVVVLEGSYYFDRANVNFSNLATTARTYTCPYKGTSLWIDLESTGNRIENVAWVYDPVLPGYENIKGKIGFYARSMRGILVEKTAA